jgi:hypothetical protein
MSAPVTTAWLELDNIGEWEVNGAYPWTNLSNAIADDGSVATVDVPYGFNSYGIKWDTIASHGIPNGAVITTLEYEMQIWRESGSTQQFTSYHGVTNTDPTSGPPSGIVLSDSEAVSVTADGSPYQYSYDTAALPTVDTVSWALLNGTHWLYTYQYHNGNATGEHYVDTARLRFTYTPKSGSILIGGWC